MTGGEVVPGWPGGLRLILLRFTALLLLTVPAAVAARYGLGERLGGDPRLVEAGGISTLNGLATITTRVLWAAYMPYFPGQVATGRIGLCCRSRSSRDVVKARRARSLLRRSRRGPPGFHASSNQIWLISSLPAKPQPPHGESRCARDALPWPGVAYQRRACTGKSARLSDTSVTSCRVVLIGRSQLGPGVLIARSHLAATPLRARLTHVNQLKERDFLIPSPN